jgi:Glyoxalase-like domain
MTLELDHLFCIVDAPDQPVERLQRDGWTLDAGSAHPGQGTQNRRLVWATQYFELLWIVDRAEAETNALRLDRRADWRTTGASPIGIALGGQVPPAVSDGYRLYDLLGPRIWVHRDNEHAPDRLLVLILETAEEELRARTPAVRAPELVSRQRADALLSAVAHGPSPARLPPYTGPPITHMDGPHRLELVVGHAAGRTPIAEILSIRG